MLTKSAQPLGSDGHLSNWSNQHMVCQGSSSPDGYVSHARNSHENKHASYRYSFPKGMLICINSSDAETTEGSEVC